MILFKEDNVDVESFEISLYKMYRRNAVTSPFALSKTTHLFVRNNFSSDA